MTNDAAVRPRASAINPATGLATDYLNHFNEAIMLLDMLPQCPECLDDFLNWTPVSYRDHFMASRLKDRNAMIAAYERAAPDARRDLERLTDVMTGLLEAARAALRTAPPPTQAAKLARRAVADLKPLIARAGAVINGAPDTGDVVSPQAVIDRLLVR